MRPKPALRTELLFYLSFLAAAALLVGVATTVVATSVVPTQEFWMVMVLVALEVGIFLVFGRHLVTRLVLRPLERLMSAADAVAVSSPRGRSTSRVTRWRPKTTKTPTSSATSAIIIQNSSPGASVPATCVVATPTSRAAAAKKER